MTPARHAAVPLPPGAEAAWEQLRAEITLRTGFWLAFLFGAQGNEVAEMVARNRDVARGGLCSVDEITVGPDAELVLSALVTPGDSLSATWLVNQVPAAPEERARRWTALLERLNERRDVVRRARPAGLVLACPAGTLPLVRDVAPDLWSFRALSVEVHAIPPPNRADGGSPRPEGPPSGETGQPPEASGSAVTRPVAPLLRRIAAAVGAERPGDALRDAEAALELADTPSERALVTGWTARARELLDDQIEAQRLARTALCLDDVNPGMRAALLRILSGSTDPDEAVEAAAELVRQWRDAIVAAPESSAAVDRLSWGLTRYGDRLHESGNVSAAREAHAEALELRRVTEDGDGGLQNLSVSLSRLGDAERDLGNPDTALTHHTESLELARRLTTTLGDTPENLRDLSVALNKVGDTERSLGHTDTALTHHTESLELARRLTTTLGDTPQTLRDLSISLDNVGDTENDLGHLGDALAHHTESLTIRRRLNTTLGDTPQTLRDLSISLDKVGDTERSLGHTDTALAYHTESLTIRRRLNTTLGDTPQTLRDLSISLDKVGDTERDLGHTDTAHTYYTEFLTIARRLNTTLGDTPQTLRDLSISLDNIGDTEHDLGHTDTAHTYYTESLTIRRRLATTLGDTPQTLRDLLLALGRVGRNAVTSDDQDRARTSLTESYELSRRMIDLFGATPRAVDDVRWAAFPLARVLAESGDRAGAVVLLEQVRDVYARLEQVPEPDGLQTLLSTLRAGADGSSGEPDARMEP